MLRFMAVLPLPQTNSKKGIFLKLMSENLSLNAAFEAATGHVSFNMTNDYMFRAVLLQCRTFADLSTSSMQAKIILVSNLSYILVFLIFHLIIKPLNFTLLINLSTSEITKYTVTISLFLW